jgi:hypothetical protein
MHTLLLDELGKILAFGCGANGRLGLGNTASIAKPAEITALSSVCAKSIACGWSSRCGRVAFSIHAQHPFSFLLMPIFSEFFVFLLVASACA